ncbi:hypothetical protein F5Y08DRAFT_20181 [Xylaria arbuscula]|nr:hypothetical protein F5Y08DRAFT_20181 [Xylaria arbuscula]
MASSAVTVYTTPPETLVDVLRRSHPLVSLPLVRRLRFAAGFAGGITEHSRILWCSRIPLEEYYQGHPSLPEEKEGEEEEEGKGKGEEESGGPRVSRSSQYEQLAFAAAYLDFSRGPETELWLYSSMEARLSGEVSTTTAQRDGSSSNDNDINGERERERERQREEIACAVALLREVKHQQDLYFVPGSPRALEREFPTVLVGNLNEVLRERLVAPGVGVDIVSTGLYDKWIFEIGKLPAVKLAGDGPGDGDVDGDGDGSRWVWDVVRREHIPFTISRTKIPRRERTMKLLPSTALYSDDGTPVAWAFLGPDSSLSSLHCEEPYRGRGIAKAVAIRVLRDHLGDYNDDAYYGWADVAPDNVQSQGVCKSLNGEPRWQISWSRLNLDQSFSEE